MTVRETGDFRKSTQEVLEDDQEDKEEGDHERKQEHADGLCEDEGLLCDALVRFEVSVGLVKDGHNELLAGESEQEDASKDSCGFEC